MLPDHAGETYRSLDAFTRAGETWIEQSEWVLVELERIIDADEHVVSLHHGRVKMLHTGIEFESALAYLFTFQDGQVVHQRAFVDHVHALRAAALAE